MYKVYKRGSNVRIDTTLLGFDHTTWQRGNRSYIFKGNCEPAIDFYESINVKHEYSIGFLIVFAAESASMIEVDHDAQDFTEFQMHSPEFDANNQVEAATGQAAAANGQRRLSDLNGITPTIESVAARLHAPVTTNRIDMEKICFERNKSGIWGWRNDKTETINGYECKVFAASNVEFKTLTRTEHLNETQARVCTRFLNQLFEKLKFSFKSSLFSRFLVAKLTNAVAELFRYGRGGMFKY